MTWRRQSVLVKRALDRKNDSDQGGLGGTPH
jgi:hypothetical protein